MHTISKRDAKVAAGGCAGRVTEGRSVQPVAGSCRPARGLGVPTWETGILCR